MCSPPSSLGFSTVSRFVHFGSPFWIVSPGTWNQSASWAVVRNEATRADSHAVLVDAPPEFEWLVALRSHATQASTAARPRCGHGHSHTTRVGDANGGPQCQTLTSATWNGCAWAQG